MPRDRAISPATPSRCLLALLLLLGGVELGASRTVPAPIEPAAQTSTKASDADWWTVEQAVVEQLFHDDLGRVVGSLAREPAPSDAAGWMRRLSLLVRAGHRQEAREAIDQLAGIGGIEKSQLSQIADALINREEWDLTRCFLERFPQAEPGWGYIFIRHWAETGEPDEIDRWLEVRTQANPGFWFAERLRFRTGLGTEAQLLDELAGEVRAHPAELDGALRYLEAVTATGKDLPLAWMGEVSRPRLAYESYKLGSALSKRSAVAAIALLERSLVLPFTEQDQKLIDQEIRHRAALSPPKQNWERELRYSTKWLLAESYKANGQADKAQALVEELAAASQNGVLDSSLGLLAGQVQKQSGARVIEKRILAAEPAKEGSSRYWLSRAAYYEGRQEHAQAVAAFEKAVELLPVGPKTPEHNAPARHQVLTRYAHYLSKQSGAAAAVRLLRQELISAPLETDYASWLISAMLSYEGDFTHLLSPGDARLWAYLAARKAWAHAEERLLWRMIRNAPAEEQDALWSRAEELAHPADPSRAKTLGWIMTRMNASARAIPLLVRARETLPEGQEKESVTLTLLEAYLDIADWKRAEAVWPAARARLAAREIPEWQGRIALAAARAGAKEDALRLWRVKSNLDRSDLRSLPELAGFGLEEQLGNFYRRIGEDDPVSWVPATALQLLGVHP